MHSESYYSLKVVIQYLIILRVLYVEKARAINQIEAGISQNQVAANFGVSSIVMFQSAQL